MNVVVVFVLAGLAVLGAVVALAIGRGGELAETHPDYAPLSLGDDGRPVTAADAARLRLPRTIWGYQPQLTDEAVHRLADALSERDARVAVLERQLRELRGAEHAEGGAVGALHGLDEHGLDEHGLDEHGADAPSGNGTPRLLRKETSSDDPQPDDGFGGEGFTGDEFAGDEFADDGFAEDEPVGGAKEERR